MTAVATDYPMIVSKLERITELYHQAINMKFDKKERLVLGFIAAMSKQQGGLDRVVQACESILEKWDEDSYPHDSSLIEETLKLLDMPYRRVFPLHGFDQDLIVYKVVYIAINGLFKGIDKSSLSRSESMIIENLQRSVKNTLIDNRNFQGDNPYYKQHYLDYSHAKPLWLELLDNDFKSYIEYFRS